MNYYCIVDASSYINISHLEYIKSVHKREESLLKLLEDTVVIRYSREVNSEITRNINRKDHLKYLSDKIPSSLKRSNNIYKLKYYNFKKTNRILFKEGDESNKGEKDNLTVALDMFKDKINCIIFIIDDNKALRGCLDGLIEAFPIINIWNSYDVIIFLYYKHKNMLYDEAERMLHDLNSLMAKSETYTESKKGKKKQEYRIKLLTNYKKYLSIIKDIKTY